MAQETMLNHLRGLIQEIHHLNELLEQDKSYFSGNQLDQIEENLLRKITANQRINERLQALAQMPIESASSENLFSNLTDYAEQQEHPELIALLQELGNEMAACQDNMSVNGQVIDNHLAYIRDLLNALTQTNAPSSTVYDQAGRLEK